MNENERFTFRKELVDEGNVTDLTEELFLLDTQIENADGEERRKLKEQVREKLSEALNTLTVDDFVPEPDSLIGQQGSYNNVNTRMFACYFPDRTALIVERNNIPKTAQSAYLQDLETNKIESSVVRYSAYFRLPVKTYSQKMKSFSKNEELADDGRFHVTGSTRHDFVMTGDGLLLKGEFCEILKQLADGVYERYKNKYDYGAIDPEKEIPIDEVNNIP